MIPSSTVMSFKNISFFLHMNRYSIFRTLTIIYSNHTIIYFCSIILHLDCCDVIGQFVLFVKAYFISCWWRTKKLARLISLSTHLKNYIYPKKNIIVHNVFSCSCRTRVQFFFLFYSKCYACKVSEMEVISVHLQLLLSRIHPLKKFKLLSESNIVIVC